MLQTKSASRQAPPGRGASTGGRPQTKIVRNREILAARRKGQTLQVISQKMGISRARVAQILSSGMGVKVTARKAKTPKRLTVTPPATPMSRVQGLLLRVARFKEVVRHAIDTPGTKMTSALSDDILGALSSARSAELAVDEARKRIDMVSRRLESRMSRQALGAKK